jgi:hypothetical protein
MKNAGDAAALTSNRIDVSPPELAIVWSRPGPKNGRFDTTFRGARFDRMRSVELSQVVAAPRFPGEPLILGGDIRAIS